VLPKTTLNIAYCNVRGLNDPCYNTLISLIHTSKYDIIIAAETWFLNRTKYSTHSFFVSESIYPTHPSTTRRQNGGLLLLASPDIQKEISTLSITQHSITINLTNTNKTMSFVYFPPSLSDLSISQELQTIGQVHYLIGDFNIRLGSLSGDKISTAKTRKTVLYTHLNQYHLSYTRNQNESTTSRTDHLFTNQNNLYWTYDTPPFKTDHQLMNIVLKDYNVLPQNNLGAKRYDLKPLYNEIFKKEFIYKYENEYATYLLIESEAALNTCCHSMILPNTECTQEIIDSTYSNFITTIINHLDNTLTMYDAQEVKSKTDTLLLSNDTPTSNNQIIRKFKRSQRNINAANPIISNRTDRTPLQECTSHYTAQFYSDEPAPIVERQNDVEFGLQFSETIIKKRILCYSSTKSIGPDNIHTIIWKSLTHSLTFMRTLSALFQLYATTSLVPSAWSICNLHLLKKDASNPIAQNTRPIALCNILRRIFEQILLKEWMTTKKPWTHLNYGQAGFRRGYSTLSHLILSDELSRRQHQYSIFLDIKSAFDSISWLKLNELLLSRNCPPASRNLILSLICKPAVLSLTVNQSERVPIKTRKGVFQGGGISAFIFSLYIDPLAISLNTNIPSHSPLALLFADDIQIKTNDLETAQFALDICSAYGDAFHLRWNLKKCAVLSNDFTQLTINNQPIPNASEYKYLGIIHKNNGLDFRQSFLSQVSKQSRLLTALLDNNWHPKTKLTIYRTFIRPITEYAITLTYNWALKHTSRSDILRLMEQQHQQALKWIFSCKRYTQTLDFLSGFGSWKYRMECLKAGLTCSLQTLSPTNPLMLSRSVYLISSSPHFILQACFKSAYWTEYQKANDSTLNFKTWKLLKLKSLAVTASRSSALISYLTPYNSHQMKALFNLPYSILSDVLAWRLNYCFSHCTCICGSTFRRPHVDCVLNSSALYNSTLQSSSYARYLVSISTSAAPNYTVLDYLLTQLEFKTFSSLLSILKSHLL
jgi:hypothetical protein